MLKRQTFCPPSCPLRRFKGKTPCSSSSAPSETFESSSAQDEPALSSRTFRETLSPQTAGGDILDTKRRSEGVPAPAKHCGCFLPAVTAVWKEINELQLRLKAVWQSDAAFKLYGSDWKYEQPRGKTVQSVDSSYRPTNQPITCWLMGQLTSVSE